MERRSRRESESLPDRVRSLLTSEPAIVFAGALLVRVVFLIETRGDPLFSILAIDARSYFELALRFAGGDFLFGREALWFPPAYPSLLGALFRLAGPEPFVVRVLQLLLGAGTAALATVLGRRFSPTVGRVAGAAIALSPVLVFYENQLLLTGPATFCAALFLVSFLSALDGRRAFASGIALGCLALLRVNALPFLPVGVLWLARTRGARSAILFAVGTAVTFAPVFLRNGIVSGTWTPLGVNGGMIFATAFAEDSHGGRALLRSPRDFGPHGAFHREAERLAGRELTLADASIVHRDRTLERIRANPGEALRLTLRKLALFANAREIEDNLGMDLLADRSIVLSGLPRTWGLLVLPAVAGAMLALRWSGRRRRDASVLVVWCGVFAASLVVFFVTARYRLPLVVPAAVLAGVTVDAALRAMRERTGRGLVLPVVVAALAAPLVLRDPGVVADPALGLVAVAASLEDGGHHDDALTVVDRAISLDPSVPGAHQNRAVALLSLGRPEEALAAATRATNLDPGLAAAWMTRGAILARRGQVGEALPSFRRAAELDPQNPEALANLARALAATGQPAEAVEIGHRAVSLGATRLVPFLSDWEGAANRGRTGED